MEWIKYDGNYEKKHYSIKTKNGYEYTRCWPNAGTFHTDNGLTIQGDSVEFIKEIPFEW